MTLSGSVLVLAVATLAVAAPAPADLKPEAVSGWNAYVAATELRRSREVRSPDRFLALDFSDAAARDRREVLGGAVLIRSLGAEDDRGRPLDPPSALVHHWRGDVFIRGASVEELMSRIERGPPPQPDLLRWTVVSRGPGTMTIDLRLRRSSIVTVVYDTEHDVTFSRYGDGRGASVSVATKIVEIRDPGGPDEHPLPAGEDRGYLWRLNAYWRYEQVPGGVMAECESLTLSREAPFGLGAIVSPIIRHIARESMEKTLTALRADLEK